MRWQIATAVALALTVSACNSEVADGYRFERKDTEHLAPETVFVLHKSLNDLRRAAPAGTVDPETTNLMAWSKLAGNRCEVHIVDPSVSYQPEWIGHEMAHCIWGQWHGEQHK